ncbi:MAG: pilus assembly protein PilM [Gammaproteobacteria bacterium]|nr:pilus assembly protein PilM [Gammaproteobacteria bacterium]
MVELTLFKHKYPTLVGVDISSASVKLLELSHTSQGYRVESYAVEHLPADAMQEKEIKNVEAIGMAVSHVVKRSRTRTKYAAIALAGSSVITKVIQMNAGLTDNELAAQIQLEAERYIPYPMAEVNIDFQVLGPSSKNPEFVDVLLAASRTEMLDTLVEILSLGGLTAKVVDIEAYALERAFSLIANQLPPKAAAQTIAIVDIGSAMTTFSVLQNGATVYTRDQIFGGKQLTEEIQRRYGLTFEEATLAKKQGGLPEDYISEVLEPFKDAVVQQVSRSLQFFFSSSETPEIDHIILAGGTATLSGLAQRVEEKMGIPCLVANPFANMSIASRVSVPTIHADAPSLMICCGLAMRSFVHDHQY